MTALNDYMTLPVDLLEKNIEGRLLAIEMVKLDIDRLEKEIELQTYELELLSLAISLRKAAKA